MKLINYYYLAGLIIGTLSGFVIGTFTFKSGPDRYYIFKIYDTDIKPPPASSLKFGFACRCVQGATSSDQSWKGLSSSTCDPNRPDDKPISLGDGILGPNLMTNPPPIPPGACCKTQPRIKSKVMPGVPPGNCLF